MLNDKKSAKSLALAGIIACLYFIVVMVFFPLSYGGIQVRVAEALSVLPLFFGEAVLGLTVGCLIANFFGNGILDVVFGTLATFVASLLTYVLGKKIKYRTLKFALGALPPIIINAIVVPFTFLLVVELKELYFISALQVFLGQFISIYIIGAFVYFPLYNYLSKKIKG